MSSKPVHLSLQHTLAAQKQRVLRGEKTEPGIVRDFILRSWERSAQSGVSVDSTECAVIDPGLLKHIREHNRALIQCTTEIFQHMFSDIKPFASNMALSNADGIIIASFVPQEETAPMPEITLGALSRENIIGTNGIGTCLAENRPIEIIGMEHFRRLGENWSCSAAPILDEQKNLLAVLNVGQHREHYHAHTFGMVKAAAYAISEQMRLRAMLRRQHSIMELLDDGIIVLTRNGSIRMMNSHAARIMGLQAPATDCGITDYLQDSPLLHDILNTSSPIQDKEARFEFTARPRACLYSVLPIAGGDDITLVLRESQRMRKVAVQMTGNRALYTFNDIIGHSSELRQAVAEARLVAPRPTTVLILGESGTGKELFAQSIHNAGLCASGPFITVNCGALPRTLLESELFGYEYGAFTGASKSGKPGKFELASGGSIFLDEIGEMPLDAQVALLRLLQNGEVTRVGGTVSRRVNVRVIAATNRNLEQMVQDGTFREDLFYRLNVYPIFIPPLRFRREDIKLLAVYFLKTFSRNLKKNIRSIDDDVLHMLECCHWPGNVRELENTMERMVNILNEEKLTMASLPPSLLKSLKGSAPTGVRAGSSAPEAAPPPLSDYRNMQEAEHIRNILLQHHGNVRRAAAALELSRPYLYQKMKQLGINIAELRELSLSHSSADALPSRD